MITADRQEARFDSIVANLAYAQVYKEDHGYWPSGITPELWAMDCDFLGSLVLTKQDALDAADAREREKDKRIAAAEELLNLLRPKATVRDCRDRDTPGACERCPCTECKAYAAYDALYPFRKG